MLNRSLPPALVVGLLISVLGDVAQLVAGLATSSLESSARWELFSIGILIAEYTLVAVGMFELARRLTGRAHTLLHLAGWLTAGILLWHVAQPVLDLAYGRREWMYAVYRWSYVAIGAMALISAIAIAVAARAFARLPIAAALVILAVLARGWVPYLTDDLHRYLWEHRVLGLVYWTVIGVAWAVGTYWIASVIDGNAPRTASDATASWTGLRQAAGALRFRIVTSIVLAVAIVGTATSVTVIKVVLIGGPLVFLASMIVCALGLLRTVRGAIPDLPRYRITLGAAITVWWAAVQLHQVIRMYRSVEGDFGGNHFEWFTAWSILGPLVAVAGLALVGSAISAYAAARANDELREAASVRTLLYVVLFASSIGIQSQLFKASSESSFILLSLIAAGAGIGALVSLAGLFTRAAESIASGPMLPTARVHEPG